MENKIEYLRGVCGVVVHVAPTNGLNFNVQLKGERGWSESYFNDDRWGGSGTLMEFKTFDEALDVGIARVDELIFEMEQRNKKRNEEN